MTATKCKPGDTHIWDSSSKSPVSAENQSFMFSSFGCRVNIYDSGDIHGTHSFMFLYIPQLFIEYCCVPSTVLATGQTEVNKAARVFTFIGNAAERRWQSPVGLFISKL